MSKKILFLAFVALATWTYTAAAPASPSETWESELIDKITEIIETNIQSMKDEDQDEVGSIQGRCKNGDVRLRDGKSNLDGRVELCKNGKWGTVCYPFFERPDATVVCKQLGFYVGDEVYKHGGGSGKIYLNWVDCKGYEGTLLQCGQGPFACRSHAEDVGISCQDDNICNVLRADSGEMGYYNVWKKRYENGLATLPEGGRKEFLTNTFQPDLERLESVSSSKRKVALLRDLVNFYSFHPAMECDLLGHFLAKHIWNAVEMPSKEFKKNFTTGYSSNLRETKLLLNLFSLNKGYNLRKEINQHCSSENYSSNELFCRLAGLAELYDKIEDFINSPTEDKFDTVRVNILVEPVWNPPKNTGDLQLHFLEKSPSIKSKIYTSTIELIFEEVKRENFKGLVKLKTALPSYNKIRGCSATNTEKCVAHALISQLASYVDTAQQKIVGKAVHKTIYAEINYKEFLNQRALTEILQISRTTQTALLDVGHHLDNQIQCTGDKVGSSILGELSTYFSTLHTFDSEKSNHDVVYVENSIKEYSDRVTDISSDVDKDVETILRGAINCARGDLAYKSAKLALAIAKNSNPIGWLTGANDPNEVLEATEAFVDALIQLKRANRLKDTLSKVQRQFKKMQDGFKKNDKFLRNVRALISSIHDSGISDIEKIQEDFLNDYGEYTPAVTAPDLTEIGATLEAVVTEACDIIAETGGPVSVITRYQNLVGESGACWETAIAIQTMMELYSEIYDFQFELMEAMASYVRARIGLKAAEDIGAAWEETAVDCNSLSLKRTSDEYALLGASSYALYELQKWQAMHEFCDILEYQNAGIRPSVCRGLKTDVSQLVGVKQGNCVGNQDFSPYYSVPLRRNVETSYRHVKLRDNFALLNVTALAAGEKVHFQIPNSDWLVEHKFISKSDKNYAIYVKQFEVFLPVETPVHTAVTVRAFSTASNRLTPGGTVYAIKPMVPLFSKYEEGHNVNCRGMSRSNPYSLGCPTSKPPNICFAGGCFQDEFIPPSIYSHWDIVLHGYEDTEVHLPQPANDMEVQISMTLCMKELRREIVEQQETDVESEEAELAEEMSESQCCSGNEYWSYKTGEEGCTPCPSGTTSTLHGYFCGDIDECSDGSHTCAQICKNNLGSYTCACRGGYVLNEDKRTCADIDECALGIDDCEQTCTNTVGSYKCGCNKGFRLEYYGGSKCIDLQGCLSNPCKEGETCTDRWRYDPRGPYRCDPLHPACKLHPCPPGETCFGHYDGSRDCVCFSWTDRSGNCVLPPFS